MNHNFMTLRLHMVQNSKWTVLKTVNRAIFENLAYKNMVHYQMWNTHLKDPNT